VLIGKKVFLSKGGGEGKDGFLKERRTQIEKRERPFGKRITTCKKGYSEH